jgi:hypothetical protein
MPFTKGHKINSGKHFENRARNTSAQLKSIENLKRYNKERDSNDGRSKEWYKKIAKKLTRFAPLKCSFCDQITYVKPCYLKYRKYCNRKCFAKAYSKENNPKWIKDRSSLKRQNRRNDPAYKEWRRQVWLRDCFKCRIVSTECNGHIEAHHILAWSDYPELRYEINNGITLCHAHHPRKKSEEKRLSPYFMELVSASKE